MRRNLNHTVFPMRHSTVAALALLLAGCAGTQDVELEGRDFTLQQNATPAAAAATSSEDITRLVHASGPTYVTLVVSEHETQGSQLVKDGNRDVPVTSGSGFVVDPSGYVMTAAHVAVQMGYSVSARAANGRVYTGKVVAILPANDMALIKLRGYMGKAVSPAGPQCLTRGEMVYSLGKPHAQGDTARIGQLESMHFGRPVAYGKFGYPDAMVLRMSTQKGESGGPLFNQQGQLVGMVVSTLSDASGNSINLAHAVPASSLAQFLCARTSCQGNWQSLSQSTAAGCS